MAWAKNGTPDTLTSGSDTLQISDLTAKKFNLFLSHGILSGNARQRTRFNSDTGSNYADRWSQNGQGDNTGVNQTFIYNEVTSTLSDALTVTYCMNISSEEKLLINFACNAKAVGVGTAPFRTESVGKWANTSVQFTDISMVDDLSGNFDTDSNLSAIGTD